MSDDSQPTKTHDEKKDSQKETAKEISDSSEQSSDDEGAKDDAKQQEVNEDIIVSGWFYLDAQGEQQGPFSTKEMRGWWAAGFFPPTLKVKRVSEDTFVTLGSRKEITEAPNGPPPAKRAKTADGASPVPIPVPVPIPMPYPYYNPMMTMMPMMAPYGAPAASGQRDEPKVQGVFNAMTGRFVSSENQSHWEKKGLPSDRDTRMMAHYFDVNSYQEQMRQAKEQPQKKQKLTKKQVEDFKKRKEDKKKRRLIQM